MHLKSIAMQGFKTFAARTTLELRPGITAVVGPNGSGKSNIADAVRWALGETNLRHVRCRTTDELIFAGNGRRSSLGVAEVSLVFANDGGWLGVPFNEVRVTRRANRSGENEYLLNGTRVRLRDIVDRLAGASIHAGGHVVVSQGLVDAVLALRPEERRPLIENLAGLKQYYLRRDEAESRLQATESNLVHVDAMIAELTPQLAGLRAQAEALRGYRAAEGELQQLQRLTFGAQAARLLERLATAIDIAAAGESTLAAAREEAHRLRSEDDRLLAALAEDRRAAEDLRSRVEAANRSVEAARRDRDVAAARAASAEERASFSRAEYARLREIRDAEQSTLDEAQASVRRAGAEAARAEAALDGHRRRVAELTHARDQALFASRQAQSRQAEAARIVARLTESLTSTQAAADRIGADIARHESDLAAAHAALRAAELASAAAGERLNALQAAETEARGVECEARDGLAAARATASAALAAQQQTTRAAEQVSARHGVLQAWLCSLEGYDAGVRLLAPMPGAVGIVSQLLRIDQPWQAAIATVLGARNDAILATDLAALFAAWRAQAGARGQVRLVAIRDEPGVDPDPPAPGTRVSTTAPVKLLSPAEALALLRELRVLAEDEVVGWASQVSGDATGALDRAVLRLDRVLLVTGANAALRCAPHVMNLGIDVVSADPVLAALADGSVVFGVEERTAETIARRVELEALDRARRQTRAADELATERLTAAQQAQCAAERAADGARATLSQAESAASRARDERRFQERLTRQAEAAASASGPLIARCRHDLAGLQRKLVDHEERLTVARDASGQARAAADSAHAAARLAEENLTAALAARRDDDTALTLLRDRGRAVARLVDDQTRRLHALAADLARHADQENLTMTAIAALVVARDDATAREVSAVAALKQLEEVLCPTLDRLRLHETAHGGLRDALHDASDGLARAEATHERTRRDADNLARDLEILRAQVSAELGCAIDELPAGSPPTGAVTRVKSLRAELAAIGPINARAEDDLLGTQERLDFLQAQSADLRDGVARLRGMISDANATVRERFTHTVEALDQQFMQFFTRLFGGGSCRLVPEYDQQGLPTGVEVHAQPPGKRTRDLALLSGGERALIAMALLFAMLRVRPVPFCLLDEVEAALDEANTGRFGAILRELSADTQFILVTHNRGTMLHADRLYGITMSESGISTAASIVLAAVEDPEAEPAGAVP